MKKEVTDRVAREAEAIAKPLGLDIYKVEFVREAEGLYLRVYLTSPAGIGIADCAKVSRALSKRLDQIDIIPESYFLEVSSPGIEAASTDKSETIKGDVA